MVISHHTWNDYVQPYTFLYYCKFRRHWSPYLGNQSGGIQLLITLILDVKTRYFPGCTDYFNSTFIFIFLMYRCGRPYVNFPWVTNPLLWRMPLNCCVILFELNLSFEPKLLFELSKCMYQKMLLSIMNKICFGFLHNYLLLTYFTLKLTSGIMLIEQAFLWGSLYSKWYKSHSI